jgi:non-specific serine/threonine protein kinase
LDRYRYLFSLAEATPDGLRVSRRHLVLIEDALESAAESQTDAEFERRRAALRQFASSGFQGIQPRQLPPGFTGELRPYQKAGFDWLHFLNDFQFGGCLADDMGLGKTVQTLAFLQSLYSREPQTPSTDTGSQPIQDLPGAVQASLLVVPRSLLVNWQREASRFTPGLRILEFFDTDRVKDTSCFNDVDLVITTYGVMLRDIQLLHGYTFYYAILDESQSIKNPLSQTARAAHLLQARHRLVLTGTPIENSTAELWSQFAFLNPGLLGSLKYFKTEFGMPIEKKRDEAAAAALRRLVFPFIMRRTKDLVAPELPPRTERILYSDMDPAQFKLYLRTRDYYRGMLLGMLEKEGLNASRMKILEGLLRLRQIANHPLLVDDKFRGSSGKFELLLDTLETLKAENHKALVFSQFVKMLSLVRKEMDARQMRYTYLDGQTTARQEQVDRFQASPEIPFFLISLKAGGLGLNLTAADYVLHIDPWWNPAVEMQASDRTHRIGQEKPVFVFKLIARDSVEEKILQLQERKRSLVDQIITTEASFFKDLTAEDVGALFS